jgi:hypothetical protein
MGRRGVVLLLDVLRDFLMAIPPPHTSNLLVLVSVKKRNLKEEEIR